MPAILVSILSGFATFLVGSVTARVASLVVFSTVGLTLVNGLLDTAMNNIASAGTAIFMVQLAGIGEGFSLIGSALILRATINAWSIRPSAAITGG